MSDYTPTTKQIAEAWHFASRDYPFKSRAKRAEFNRWLAEHDRQLSARIYAEGYQAASSLRMGPMFNAYKDGAA
jgi:ferric-dicitrate binding protein FerR (iron transport regulator)